MTRIERKIGSGHGVVAVIVAVAGLLILSPLVEAQLGRGRMQGTVTDTEGNPIPGVKVTAENPNVTPSTLSTTTDEDGNWAIMGFNNADWSFTFEKEGYIPQKIDASVRTLSKNPDMDVTLEKADPETAGGAGAGAEAREKFNEGTQAYEAGNYNDAIASWKEFAEANASVYQIWVNIGNAHRKLGEVEKAREAFQKVLEEDPQDTRARYNLGEMAVEEGDFEKALPHFEAVIESNPQDPAVFYNVGEIYFESRNVDRAIEFYQHALEVDPTFLPAQRQLGYAYINKGDEQAALSAFEKYLEIAPEGDPEVATVQNIVAALREGS